MSDTGQEPGANPPEGQEPAAPGGQEPEKTREGSADDAKGQEPKAAEAQWIKELRQENARSRKALQEAEKRLREFEDRDKTEQQKLQERAERAEAQAAEADRRLLRLQVAAEKNLTAAWVDRLRGDTLEELQADAEQLLAQIAGQQPGPPRTSAFDPGARERPAEKRSPTEEHADFLMQALGRRPTR